MSLALDRWPMATWFNLWATWFLWNSTGPLKLCELVSQPHWPNPTSAAESLNLRKKNRPQLLFETQSIVFSPEIALNLGHLKLPPTGPDRQSTFKTERHACVLPWVTTNASRMPSLHFGCNWSRFPNQLINVVHFTCADTTLFMSLIKTDHMLINSKLHLLDTDSITQGSDWMQQPAQVDKQTFLSVLKPCSYQSKLKNNNDDVAWNFWVWPFKIYFQTMGEQFGLKTVFVLILQAMLSHSRLFPCEHSLVIDLN